MTSTANPSFVDDTELDELVRLYYHAFPADELMTASPAALAETVRAHHRMALVRPPGRPLIEVRAEPADGSGQPSATTLIQVVTDDMAYLVDSVIDELNRGGLRLRHVVHPIVVVRRDGAGVLDEVLAHADPEFAPPGSTVESWMSFEVDRIAGPDRVHELVTRLETVLDDVREVAGASEQMRRAALRLADELRSDPPPMPHEDAEETAALLRWLADGHFMFLGYRFGETGLGLLRPDCSLTVGLDLAAPGTGAHPLVLTLASGKSTVHGPGTPFYLAVRTFGPDGRPTGEHRFVGAFTLTAKHQNVATIPVVGKRVRRAIHQAGVPLGSYSGQRMLRVLHDFPRSELFSADWEFLHRASSGVLALAGQHRVRLFVREDPYRRFLSCLVYLPRDSYTTASRRAMQEVLLSELGGTSVDYRTRAAETGVSVWFVVHVEGGRMVRPDLARIQERLCAAVRTWDDSMIDTVLAGRHALQDGEGTAEFARRYASAFPEAYKEDFDTEVGLADLHRLRALSGEGDQDLLVYLPRDAEPGEARLKLYLSGRRVTLSAVLPVLQRMGVEVVDERPYQIDWDATPRWIFDIGLRCDRPGAAEAWRDEGVRSRFENAFAAAWRGDAEVDGFNSLVLRAGLDWRQASLLRAYAKYLRQIGTNYSRSYVQDTLLEHPKVAVALVGLFAAKFDPDLPAEVRHARVGALETVVGRLVDEVTSLDADRILRGYFGLIQATVRTNYFLPDAATQERVLSLKLDSQAIPGLPQPWPRWEIFVCSPRLEGVHLRFGPVARGGLRWSDRREDFRTEILGLVKAQAVKNAVIVPVGAKGGFVLKRPPADSDALRSEGAACYRMFISGLLDVTDNLVRGQVVPPARVVRHDDDDPYLVVAADKGTATFSDIANEVAASYDFWLGDAFASGGSVGYDHKAMGITARGAWESVQRHFRELGVDTQAQDFTVVGVGDMSGDVFGNGMLLSKHIRLIAAFDHRHVFVDPDPDPAVSFTERLRLCTLARSSWADYDRGKISPGGGVWAREVKSVPVSAPMRAALGLDATVDQLPPNELIKAILLAPADLLWNGGIGTYVKASGETHAEVRDKANDAVRVDGCQLRVKVVGEGGNLGLTQRGRIEFAASGGKVNTDALDNCAGVDCSDHEVNIKILMDQLVAAGSLSTKDRNRRLAEMTGEVAELVLANNRRQNTVLGVSRSHAPAMLGVHARLVTDLERRHGLDRRLAVLPTREEFAALERDGRGLSSPELATLLAHVKLALKDEVLADDLLDGEAFTRRLPEYFPRPLRGASGGTIANHPLRRQIGATLVVNDVVDNGGLTYAFRLANEMAVSAADAVCAFTVVTEVYDLHSRWQWIDTDGRELPTPVTDRLILQTRRLLDRASRWMLSHRPQPLAVGAEIDRFRPVVRELGPVVADLLKGSERRAIDQETQRLVDSRVPEPVARRHACLLATYALLDIAEIAELAEHSRAATAELYFALSEHLGVDAMLNAVAALEHGNRWHALARLALRDDLYHSLSAVTLDVLLTSDPAEDTEEKIGNWQRGNTARLAGARRTLEEIGASGRKDLPTLSVAANQIRRMVR